MLFSTNYFTISALLLPALGAATTTQPAVKIGLFTAPGCVSATQIGPIDVSSKIFATTNSTCIPAPNSMTDGLVSYLSFRTYFANPEPAGTFCATTVYSDAACTTKVSTVAPVGSQDGNDCTNAIPQTTTNLEAVAIKSFDVVCAKTC